jgi:Transglycosylase-like domain
VSFILTGLTTSFASAGGERGPYGYKTGLTRIAYANAYCESGGYPYIKTNSKYRGKWQFDQSTWYSHTKGTRWHGLRNTDPAIVPEWIQDQIALRVRYDAWPNC